MLKKISLGIIGLAFLASPLFVSAQSLADLQAQVQALLAQLAALQEQQNPPPTPTGYCPNLSRDLARPTSGDDVRQLQRFLVSQGLLDSENVSGNFGPLTESAVKEFQQKHGLYPSGAVRSETRAAIARVCGGGQEGSTDVQGEQAAPGTVVAQLASFTASTNGVLLGATAIFTELQPVTASPERLIGYTVDWGDGSAQVHLNQQFTTSIQPERIPQYLAVYRSGSPYSPGMPTPGNYTARLLREGVEVARSTYTIGGSSQSYSWSTGGWGQCENGRQTRAVQCRSNIGAVVADSNCAGTKPETYQSCSVFPQGNPDSYTFEPVPYASGPAPFVVTRFSTVGPAGSSNLEQVYVEFGDGTRSPNHPIGRVFGVSQSFGFGPNEHVYVTPGNYTAVLRRSSDNTSLATKVITVTDGGTTGDIWTMPYNTGQSALGNGPFLRSVTPRTGIAPLTVQFVADNLSRAGLAFLDFGDGTTAPQPSAPYAGDWSISHTYAQPGTYYVTLKTPYNLPGQPGLNRLLSGATILLTGAGSVPAPTYSWHTGEWSQCSTDQQTRTVQCKSSTGTVVADSYCTTAKPAVSQSCTTYQLKAPNINSFSASPASVPAGSPSTLSWSATNSTSDGGCFVFAGPITTASQSVNPIGNQGFSGSVIVKPTTDTTYTLQCYASWKDGSPSSSRTLSVDVAADATGTDYFTASPSSGTVPFTVTFGGVVNAASSCSASSYTVLVGENQAQQVDVPANQCAPKSFSLTHTYQTAGFHTIALYKGSIADVQQGNGTMIQYSAIDAKSAGTANQGNASQLAAAYSALVSLLEQMVAAMR